MNKKGEREREKKEESTVESVGMENVKREPGQNGGFNQYKCPIV